MCSSFDFVPAPNSLDLSSLVQTQLLKAEQQLPNHRLETLDDLRSMVGKLSEITNICVDYIDNAKEKPTRRAFQEMEYGFEWNNCEPWPLQRSAQDDIIYSLRYALVLQAVEIGPSPPAPTFLFRAARNTSHRTSYVPPAARRWSFIFATQPTQLLRYFEILTAPISCCHRHLLTLWVRWYPFDFHHYYRHM